MVQKFILRIKSFFERVSWLGNFAGGPIAAGLCLIRIKLGCFDKGRGNYKGHKFQFSQGDLSAIREVLADEEYAFLADIIKKKPSPVIADIGSNIGLFAIWSFALNPKSRVFSIEASPDTYKTLHANIELSRVQNCSWLSLHAAAWSGNGHVSFVASGESMGHKVDESGSANIPSVSYSTLIRKIKESFGESRIDLAKIDIEGSEEAFLCQKDVSLENILNLVIELHPEKCDTDKVYDFLRSQFKIVEEIGGRASRKPLLLCTNEV